MNNNNEVSAYEIISGLLDDRRNLNSRIDKLNFHNLLLGSFAIVEGVMLVVVSCMLYAWG